MELIYSKSVSAKIIFTTTILAIVSSLSNNSEKITMLSEGQRSGKIYLPRQLVERENFFRKLHTCMD